MIDDVARLSEGRVRLRTGTVYSILDRLRENELIEVASEEIVASRLRRYYRLTPAGVATLSDECEALRRRADVAVSSLRQPRATSMEALAPDRPAGPPARPAFEHPALLYRNEASYLAGTVPFVTAGLENGEAVAVAVPTANLALLRKEFGRQASHIYMVDITGAGRNPGRILPNVLLAFVESHAGQRIRIVGEPLWPTRTPAEYAGCLQHEALVNLAFADRPVTILCPYDALRLDPRALHDAARTHPTLIDERGSRPSEAYAPEQVLDECNVSLPVSETDWGAVTVFDFSEATIPQARAYAAAAAIRLGLPAARRSDVERVISELASNSARHGGGHGRLRVWAAEGYVMCQIDDAGTLGDPLAGRRPVPDHQQSGRGLLIVNRAADLVRTHSTKGHTSTRAYFAIAPQ